jgi:hypothetical protein
MESLADECIHLYLSVFEKLKSSKAHHQCVCESTESKQTRISNHISGMCQYQYCINRVRTRLRAIALSSHAGRTPYAQGGIKSEPNQLTRQGKPNHLQQVLMEWHLA